MIELLPRLPASEEQGERAGKRLSSIIVAQHVQGPGFLSYAQKTAKASQQARVYRKNPVANGL